MRHQLVIGFGATALMIAGTSSPVTGEPETRGIAYDDVLLGRLSLGVTSKQYAAELVAEMRMADRAGDGLDRADVDFASLRQRARARAAAVASVLDRDLDGDFRVTKSELQIGSGGQAPGQEERANAYLELLDINHDNVITLDEMAASARETTNQAKRLKAMLSLDPDKDGLLTADELQLVAIKVFESIDSDGDGKLSSAEYVPIGKRLRLIDLDQSAPICAMPLLPEQAQLVVLTIDGGPAISSVSVGGLDKATALTDIEIEPGSAPLYIVLTSYHSMVWRLTGATERVAQVVVSSWEAEQVREAVGKAPPRSTGALPSGMVAYEPPLALSRGTSASGVVGVPPSKVTVERSDCPRYISGDDDFAAKYVMATVRHAVGREADLNLVAHMPARVALPSGKLQPAGSRPLPPQGFDPEMWREAVRYWPSGLVAVDPLRVVARAKVDSYEVLPSQMGLAQLIGAGAIERTADGRLRLVRPISHLPPAMGGAHSVSIILADNVPMPPGDPVHSCVMPEPDWKRLKPGQRCLPGR